MRVVKQFICGSAILEDNVRPEPGTYITHNAMLSLSEITWGNLSDYMQRPLEPQNALFNLYYVRCSTPQNLLRHFNV